MDLSLDLSMANGFSSNSQIARVLSEGWVSANTFCPCCGNDSLTQFENNRPVADLYCPSCNEQYELKSKKNGFSKIVSDGAYSTMIQRINSRNNPNLFLLSYSNEYQVSDLIIIPKQFITSDIIIQRAPLAATARRAGWVGCNINISQIPEIGKVQMIKNFCIIEKSKIQSAFQNTLFVRNLDESAKGWLLEIIKCIEIINNETFELIDLYRFEDSLSIKFPKNNHIKDKIRQQLQILREKRIIEFTDRGKYKIII